MVSFLPLWRAGVLGCVMGMTGLLGSAALADDALFRFAYEPRGLDWTAAEVERATRESYDAVVVPAARERQLGCAQAAHCARYQRIFDRLLVLARQQNAHAASLPWSLTVVRGDTVEAMALPGGQVLLSEAFVESRQLSDEALAFVLGHEMSHSILEHERQTLHFARMLLPREVPRTVKDIYTEIDFNMALLKSLEPVMQQGEYEADELGLLLASAAGYAPERQLGFIEQELQRGDASTPFVATHPPVRLRWERLRAQLPLAERVHAMARAPVAAPPPRPAGAVWHAARRPMGRSG